MGDNDGWSRVIEMGGVGVEMGGVGVTMGGVSVTKGGVGDETLAGVSDNAGLEWV